MNAQGEVTVSVRKAKILRFPPVSQNERRLLLPREHGSWALWLLPLVSGGIVGYAAAPSVAAAPALSFCLLATAAFLIRQPLESLLGVSVLKVRSVREQQIAVFWVIGLTAIVVLGVVALLQLQRGLVLLFGVAALGCFALAALCGRARAFRIPKQLVGALGLTSTAAGAYYVTAGRVDRTALVLWLACWLFAAAQIEYVQLRLRTANARSRRDKIKAGWQICFLHLLLPAGALAGAAALAMPQWLALAFVPAVFRVFVWMFSPVRPLRLYVLGFSELLQNIVFAALLTAAFLAR
jgi:hypothetical protein